MSRTTDPAGRPGDLHASARTDTAGTATAGADGGAPGATGPITAGTPPPGAVDRTRPNVVLLVMLREMRVRALSKGLLFSTAFTLLAVVALIVVPNVLSGGPDRHEVGIVGSGGEDIVAAAQNFANAGVTEESERTTIEVVELTDAAAAEQAVRDGDVDAAIVDGTEVVVERSGGFASNDLLEVLQQAAGAEQAAALVGGDRLEEVRGALSGEALSVTTLSGQDAAQAAGRSALAYGGLMITYLMILQYGNWTLMGVAEEKTNRVMEILVSSGRPWQLFAGKVLGSGLLGIGQFVLTVGAALVAIRVTGAFDLPSLPVAFAAALTLWVLVGFGLYLVLYGAAGALAAKMEDAQSAQTPVTILIVVGFLASFTVLGNPSGPVALVTSFVPFTAPFVVPIRVALEAIPLWQQGLALALSAATVAGLTMLAGRVYRGGSLNFSGRTGWRQALRRAE